nr:MAG TPA: hypothetical protein [Bacteriophage sp.]
MLRIKVKGFENVSVVKLLLDYSNLDTVLTKITVEQTYNLLCGALQTVRLGHVNVTLAVNQVRIGAKLTGTTTNARGGDNINEIKVLITNLGKRSGVGKRISDLDGAFTSSAVNSADVTIGNVQLNIVSVGKCVSVLNISEFVRHKLSPLN